LRSPSRTIYFAGDTGYCPTFKEIGERFGSIDLALIPIGAYRPRWIMQSIHVNPQEAVQIHLDVRARQSIASHWGTFRLTDEPLNEPPALLRQALANQSLPPEQFRTLRFGESIVI
jgi:N-acyl-phosphatidylethanolamine-hydrolysing phospholipase D